MEVGNVPNKMQIQRQADQVAPILAEDLTTANVEKRKGKKGVQPKPEMGKKPKTQRTKPMSVSLFNQETDATEMVDDFFDRIALKQSKKHQENTVKQLKQESKTNVDKLFTQKEALTSKDAVLLSSAAQTFQQKTIKEQQNAERRESSPIKPRETRTTREIGSKGAAQTSKGTQASKTARKGHQLLVQLYNEEKSGELKTLIRNYLTTFSESIINSSPQKALEATNLRDMLLKKGYSTKNLKQLEHGSKQMLRSDLKKQIKSSFIQYALAYSNKKYSSELVENRANFKYLTDMGELYGLFGEGRVNLDDIKKEAKDELKFMLSDELDTSLAVTAAKGDSTDALAKAFDRFNALATLIKFDPGEFIKNIRVKLNDLGDLRFSAQADPLKPNSDQGQGGSKGRNRDDEAAERMEKIHDELRMTLMQIFMQRGFFSGYKLKKKMKQLKKQLKQFHDGNEDEEFEKLQKEGKALARLRYIDKLRTAYEEEATLPKLKGTEYQIVKRKEKTVLKGLTALGFSLDKYSQKLLRDQVNKALFPVIKEEYLKIEVFLQTNPHNPKLMSNRKRALAILERIKEESGIQEDIRPASVKDITFSSDTNVAERA